MAKKTPQFEQQIQRLEDIVDMLDSGEQPLEELLNLYEEGMKISQSLKQYLDQAEQKIIDITQNYQAEQE